ncbi:MAG: hypothetical protein R2800_02585 [Flavipsychrobacter sp.]
MFRKTLLYTALYKSIALPSLIITSIVVVVSIVTRVDKDLTSIAPNSIMKLVSTAVFLYLIHFRKRKELYYYYNLHISQRGLFLVAALIDMFIYTLAMTMVLIILPSMSENI